MKSSINSDQSSIPQGLPYIGVSKMTSGKVVLFTELSSCGKAKGIILAPGHGLSSRKIGDWVTYPLNMFQPLVGTITLEN